MVAYMYIRKKFWILNDQSTVRRVLRKCLHCRIQSSSTGEQLMAPLPSSRITPGNPPFTCVGVDYMGPIMVKQGRSQLKRYGCVFSCLATRAIHIEISNSLETDSFIHSYRRFCNRRGTPKMILSDNGTNFIGAEKELRNGIQNWNNLHIHKSLRQDGVEWRFNPPRSSHQGGVWERMIRTIRKVLRGLTNDQVFTDEMLYTFITEVERIINNRPLTPLSDDPKDQLSISPQDILIGRLDSTLPPDEFIHADGFKKSWRKVQRLADCFWKRWVREYIPLLQERQKWLSQKQNFAAGDLVLIVNEDIKHRGHWPKAIIEEVFKDKYGVVRSARVRTFKSTYVRDIRKLVLLEAHMD